MLYGFSGVILQGALVTLELAISSVVLAVIIGLIGAGGKLSQNRLSGLIFEGYTTRGYSVQGIESTDFQRKPVLSESTPYCVGKNPQDAKQHHFHGKAETDVVRRQGWKS